MATTSVLTAKMKCDKCKKKYICSKRTTDCKEFEEINILSEREYKWED
jgi:hypothetical protein